MRRHESPNPETGKSIVVIEDATLPEDSIQIVCAHSDADIAHAFKSILDMGGGLNTSVLPTKGHPRNEMHLVVSPADYDRAVELVEDDDEAPAMGDAEFASRLMEATRRNN